MRTFTCPPDGTVVYFENLACACGLEVAWNPATGAMTTEGPRCANRGLIGCNWLAADDGGLCAACRMTEVTPDLSLPREVARWAEGEAAKRWVVATIARWGWLLNGDPGPMPRFHFLAEETREGDVQVTMGHAGGLITLSVAEADSAIRNQRRAELNEPYRTLMGHVRHELAHYLFERLATSEDFATAFRERFGDERTDYGAALDRHYRDGPPQDWAERHLSAYASMHPHEDWAETAAHLLHLTDILDSAVATGLLPGPNFDAPGDPYAAADAEKLVTDAVALGLALNQVNRSMGLPDLYPFVLSPVAREKLAFAHRWLTAGPPEAEGRRIETTGAEAAA